MLAGIEVVGCRAESSGTCREDKCEEDGFRPGRWLLYITTAHADIFDPDDGIHGICDAWLWLVLESGVPRPVEDDGWVLEGRHGVLRLWIEVGGWSILDEFLQCQPRG